MHTERTSQPIMSAFRAADQRARAIRARRLLDEIELREAVRRERRSTTAPDAPKAHRLIVNPVEIVHPDLVDLAQPPIARVSSIVAAVSSISGVPERDVVAPSRKKRVFWLRAAICLIALRATGKSAPEVSGSIGRRDHSTVFHAAARAEERAEADAEFKRLLAMAASLARQIEARARNKRED